MPDKSKPKKNDKTKTIQDNGFWKEWFENSEAALKRDEKTIRKTLKEAQKIDPEKVLTGSIKL